MNVKIDEKKCTGCGICIEVCPVSAITVDRVAAIEAAACTGCGACVDECPNGAIYIERSDERLPAPSIPPAAVSRARFGSDDVTRPSATLRTQRPLFRQIDWGGIIGRIFESVIDGFANQARGPGAGRGKGRGGGGNRGGRGRGRSRWR